MRRHQARSDKIFGVGAAGVLRAGVFRVGLGDLDEGFKVRRETRGRGVGWPICITTSTMSGSSAPPDRFSVASSGTCSIIQPRSADCARLPVVTIPSILIWGILPHKQIYPDLADEGESEV